MDMSRNITVKNVDDIPLSVTVRNLGLGTTSPVFGPRRIDPNKSSPTPISIAPNPNDGSFFIRWDAQDLNSPPTKEPSRGNDVVVLKDLQEVDVKAGAPIPLK
jgi:hypothetical protein